MQSHHIIFYPLYILSRFFSIVFPAFAQRSLFYFHTNIGAYKNIYLWRMWLFWAGRGAPTLTGSPETVIYRPADVQLIPLLEENIHSCSISQLIIFFIVEAMETHSQFTQVVCWMFYLSLSYLSCYISSLFLFCLNLNDACKLFSSWSESIQSLHAEQYLMFVWF